MLRRLREWARRLKRDVIALYLAARDPRVPWHAKMLAACVAAYALSPIDLIPDFIPVLGYLDDVILVPAGIWLTIWMIPPNLMAEHRAAAVAMLSQPSGQGGAVAIVAIWIVLAGLACWMAYRWLA